MEWEIKTRSLVVKPLGKEMYDEGATTITVDDEGAGSFFIIEQCRDDQDNKILIDPDEWEFIKVAMDRMKEEWK